MNLKQATLILGLGVCSSAFAADPGIYLGGGGGQANYSGGLVGQMQDAFDQRPTLELLSADVVDDTSTVWKFFAGYRFSNGFGLEASFVDLGSAASLYHAKVVSILQPSPDFLLEGRYDAQAYGLSAFYEWAFSPTFSASVRAGAFNTRLDFFQHNTTIYDYPDFSHTNHDTVPGFGLGLTWRLTPSFDLRLDYDRYQGIGKRFGFEAEDTNGRFDIGVATLNLAYRFGR